MVASSAEEAVRSYLTALRDPSSLRDSGELDSLRAQLEDAADPVDRLRLRQQILDAEDPSIDRYEDAFVTHAKAWAEEHGVTAKAFADEGVPEQVLRRAGLVASRRRAGRAARASAASSTRTRVSADEVRAAIPSGTFTTKTLQELSGASPAVVRRVISEEEAADRLVTEGRDPDHRGPGRAPTLYRRP
jgi:hypothetical protein